MDLESMLENILQNKVDLEKLIAELGDAQPAGQTTAQIASDENPQ